MPWISPWRLSIMRRAQRALDLRRLGKRSKVSRLRFSIIHHPYGKTDEARATLVST